MDYTISTTTEEESALTSTVGKYNVNKKSSDPGWVDWDNKKYLDYEVKGILKVFVERQKSQSEEVRNRYELSPLLVQDQIKGLLGM